MNNPDPRINDCLGQLRERDTNLEAVEAKAGATFDGRDILELTATRDGVRVAVRALALTQASRRVRECAESINLSALHHPHIVSPKSIIRSNDYLYITTEYANGGDLFRMVRRGGPLELRPARFLFQQLILALQFCHRQGIYVRNINPANLLLFWTDSGVPVLKLSDMTFAKDTMAQGDAQTPVTANVLTCPQMIRQLQRAPEDWEALSPVCDVWSATVVLYFMLTGKWPFSGAEVQRWVNTPAEQWQYSADVLNVEGLDGGARGLIRSVFDRGSQTAEEYRASGGPSVDDIVATAWFQKDLPHGTDTMQEDSQTETDARRRKLQNAVTGRDTPTWVDAFRTFLENRDQAPLGTHFDEALPEAVRAAIPRPPSAASLQEDYEVVIQPAPGAAGHAPGGGGDVDDVNSGLIRAAWFVEGSCDAAEVFMDPHGD